MLVFQAGEAAVRCGLSVLAKTAAEPEFPRVHIGAHAGEALFREGDYLGATVNVAARVASEARQGQFLVTEAVRGGASGVGEACFVAIGERSLKGVSDDLALFEVKSASTPERRPIDPVCGMTIQPTLRGPSLSWHDGELFFCSDRCLQRFVNAPERYVSDR